MLLAPGTSLVSHCDNTPCQHTSSNKSWCVVGQGTFALRKINQMGWEMCSYLEWHLNVEPIPLEDFKAIDKGFKGSGPYPAHLVLPVPSSGPFVHLKPSANNNPMAIASFGSGTPPAPLSTTPSIPMDKPLRRSSADAYSVPSRSQLPTSLASHSNVPSHGNSMSPATVPNYGGDTAKIVFSAGSNPMYISGDDIFPPCHHHVHTRESSLPMPVHPKSQMTLDTKHTSPKKTSSTYQHAVNPTPSMLSPGHAYGRNNYANTSMFHLPFVLLPPSWPIFHSARMSFGSNCTLF